MSFKNMSFKKLSNIPFYGYITIDSLILGIGNIDYLSSYLSSIDNTQGPYLHANLQIRVIRSLGSQAGCPG